MGDNGAPWRGVGPCRQARLVGLFSTAGLCLCSSASQKISVSLLISLNLCFEYPENLEAVQSWRSSMKRGKQTFILQMVDLGVMYFCLLTETRNFRKFINFHLEDFKISTQ
jgi:hypothetical protein